MVKASTQIVSGPYHGGSTGKPVPDPPEDTTAYYIVSLHDSIK